MISRLTCVGNCVYICMFVFNFMYYDIMKHVSALNTPSLLYFIYIYYLSYHIFRHTCVTNIRGKLKYCKTLLKDINTSCYFYTLSILFSVKLHKSVYCHKFWNCVLQKWGNIKLENLWV